MQSSHRWLAWCLGLVLCAVVIGAASYRARGFRVSTSDFDDFHQTIRQGLYVGETRTMPTQWGVFNYHPFFMVVMAPFGLLPMGVSCGVFVGSSIVAFGLAVRMTICRLCPVTEGRRGVVAVVSVVLVLPFAVNSLLLGQLDCLVFSALLLAWAFLEDRRDIPAGLLIAAAMLIKAFPGILLVWLLFKRKYRALLGALLGLALGAGLLPSLLFGPRENAALHARWFDRVVITNSGLNELVRTEGQMWLYTIESLPILLRRYLTPQPYSTRAPGRTLNFASLHGDPVRIGPVTLAPLQWIYVALVAGLTAAMCWVIRYPAARLPAERLRFEFAFVVLVGVLLSPFAWGARYFLMAWFGVALLVREVYAGHSAKRHAWFDIAVLVVWVVSLGMWSERLRAFGVHYWAAAILTLWLGVRAGRAQPGGDGCGPRGEPAAG